LGVATISQNAFCSSPNQISFNPDLPLREPIHPGEQLHGFTVKSDSSHSLISPSHTRYNCFSLEEVIVPLKK